MVPKLERGKRREGSSIALQANGVRMSGPGLARRQLLLNTARKMLRTTRLAELSLGEVARRAKVAKGSAYFFYTDVNALCASLKGLIDEELQEVLRAPVTRSVPSWQEVFRVLIDRGIEFLKNDPAACQLAVGVDASPALKLMDRANDVVLGRIFDEQISQWFRLPLVPDRPKLFFRALELADVMLSLSMLEHGKITPEYAEEASRAGIAYLQTYIPEKLAPKGLEPPPYGTCQ
jgi:AcrR family transcriptional regulator